MEATSISGQVDIPITVGTIVIAALIGLWVIHKVTVNIG